MTIDIATSTEVINTTYEQTLYYVGHKETVKQLKLYVCVCAYSFKFCNFVCLYMRV